MSGYGYAAMAGMQLAGGYFASQNIKATAELNKDIADMNAEFAELDAYDAITQGEYDKALYQKQVDDTLAQQNAILQAQDVDTNYGTASTIDDETRFIGRMNMMQIEKNAQMQALGYQRQARDIRLGAFTQYASDQGRASAAMTSGIMGAMNTGLTGYARTTGMKYGGPTGPKHDEAGGTSKYSRDYLDDPNL